MTDTRRQTRTKQSSHSRIVEHSSRPRFITVKEAADMLGLAEDTVHHLKGGTHKLTRVRFGRAVRMIQQEVDDHINQRLKDGQRSLN
jgi:excisionase family DNA binding protein